MSVSSTVGTRGFHSLAFLGPTSAWVKHSTRPPKSFPPTKHSHDIMLPHASRIETSGHTNHFYLESPSLVLPATLSCHPNIDEDESPPAPPPDFHESLDRRARTNHTPYSVSSNAVLLPFPRATNSHSSPPNHTPSRQPLLRPLPPENRARLSSTPTPESLHR